MVIKQQNLWIVEYINYILDTNLILVISMRKRVHTTIPAQARAKLYAKLTLASASLFPSTTQIYSKEGKVQIELGTNVVAPPGF